MVKMKNTLPFKYTNHTNNDMRLERKKESNM